MTTAERIYNVGDRVTPDPDGYGVPRDTLGRVFVVRKVNKVNLTCDAEDGGRGIRFPPRILLPATEENLSKATAPRPFVPREFFTAGEIVTTTAALKGVEQDEPFVVLKDNGEKVNVAKLGGDNDRYWRLPHAALTRRDRDWLAEKLVG